MPRKFVDIAVIIPDASPVLTLGRVGRIDLLGSFIVPISSPPSRDVIVVAQFAPGHHTSS